MRESFYYLICAVVQALAVTHEPNSFWNLVRIFRSCSFAFYMEEAQDDSVSDNSTVSWNNNNDTNYFADIHSFLSPYKISWTISQIKRNTSDIIDLKKHQITDRYGQCSVVLYPQTILDELTTQQYEILQLKRQPIIFLFMAMNAENNLSVYESSINSLNFPSIFMEVTELDNVNIICTPCESMLIPINVYSKVKSVSHLETIWNVLHSDFNMKPVEVFPVWNTSEIVPLYGTCMGFSKNKVDHRICTILAAMERLNFSMASSDEEEAFIGSFNARLPLVNANLLEMPSKNFSWLSYGMSMSPYAFVIVLDHVPGHFQTILQPIDIPSQVSIVVSIASIMLILNCFSSSKSSEALPNAAFALVGLMLEQPSINLNEKSLVQLGLWSSWSFATWQITGLYKSAIFSYLSVQPSPTTPTNLVQLISSNINISTLSVLTEYNDTGFVIGKSSTFRDNVVVEMLNSSNGQQILSPAFIAHLKYLRENLKWLNISVSLMISENFVNLNESGGPGTLGFVDNEETVETIGLLISIFSNLWVSNIVRVPVFMDRSFWIVYKNIFLPKFTQHISRIHESGLYVWWTYDLRFRKRQEFVKEIANLTTNSSIGSTGWKKSSVSSIIENERFINYLLWLEHGTTSIFDSMEFIPKIVYKHVFLTSLVIILASFGIFILECMIDYITKYRKRKRIEIKIHENLRSKWISVR
ncbi:unnamed protein product [Orchesella dallaii]|uniref:Uncharacterized protein n=1 Tax=Orchesella dallaii TaxID=48710 RepID=A0ABP1QBF2_9HEXA